MDEDIKKLILEMTLEEKAGLCSGLDFWHTKSVERLGIPSIMMADGPHGLRKQSGKNENLMDNNSIPATCFPTFSAVACSWDRELTERLGAALGEECLAEKVSILLGPGTNIKRSPLCGRNFEYFSEDPYLSAEMAASHIKGVQNQGIGTSLKHFAANNQECRRMTINALVDERTLREIYLASFEGAVAKSEPWTVMCSYNKLNGEYTSENKYLLTDILRKEWGYKGFVMSDWGAVNERTAGLAAGLELEMPSSGGIGDKKIIEAVNAGVLSEEMLNIAVEKILKVVLKAVKNIKNKYSYDREAHHKLAQNIARESIVLLKNKDRVLPLKKSGTIAVIGSFAKIPRYQGGGSSHVNASILDIPYEEIVRSAGSIAKVLYASGYRADEYGGAFNKTELKSNSDLPDNDLIKEAKAAAVQADVAVIFAGLPDAYESEGFDRKHLEIPKGQQALIEEVGKIQPNTIVVLSNGSPVEMPWLCSVKGVIEGYLGGQGFGRAIADILFGEANPCGKLAETFPQRLCDTPSFLNFPGDKDKVEYREGLFVGYRYYDAKEIEPLFPFGFGLSYTNFEYSNISIDKKELYDNEELTITFKIKNTGEYPGKEIAQLYVRDLESSVIRPLKELKGFVKAALNPGEEESVSISLNKRAFAYYNTEIKDWYVESGDFEILIGKSSADIVLTEMVHVKSTNIINKPITANTTVYDIISDPRLRGYIDRIVENLFGGAFTKLDMGEYMPSMLKEIPLRSLPYFYSTVTEENIKKLLEHLNNPKPYEYDE